MYDILTLNKISKVGLDCLGNEFVISDKIDNPHAILVRSHSLINMDFPSNLLAIARAGVGVNNIPVDKCSKNGIVVFNTPSANANAVKELVIAGLIMSSRRISNAMKWINNLDTQNIDFDKTVENYKSIFSGSELKNKTLGIIGLGSIGTLVANAAVNLDMNVLGYDPYISIESAWKLSSQVIHVDDINELFTKCDYISLHVPLTSVTENMINKNTISKMKPGVHLLNYSRAGIVNTNDIINAIDSGHVKTYATDFPKKDFLNKSNIIVTPHLGASTSESEENCAIMASKQVKDFIKNGNIINSVNIPDIFIERSSNERICIFYSNSSDAFSQISNLLSTNNIKIQNMQSRSKNDFAYAIIDINEVLSDKLFESISKINGVIRLRLIKS